MARLSGRALAIALLCLSGLTLAGCGRDGLGEARSACEITQKGLALIQKAQAPGTSANQADLLLRQARSFFIRAEGHAARATSANGRWNALMTSLQLTRRVPVTNMVPTLTRQCKSIMSDNYLY